MIVIHTSGLFAGPTGSSRNRQDPRSSPLGLICRAGDGRNQVVCPGRAWDLLPRTTRHCPAQQASSLRWKLASRRLCCMPCKSGQSLHLVVSGTLHRRQTAAAVKRTLLDGGEDRRTLFRPGMTPLDTEGSRMRLPSAPNPKEIEPRQRPWQPRWCWPSRQSEA
jgi:hypothetical protein